MEFPIINFGGGEAGSLQLTDAFIARKYNAVLVQQVMRAHFANARQGTRAQKTRAEVHHTTRKLFRQKGSGRARGGMSSSPIRVGGGRAFPSRPDENFSQKIPRKMFRAAMSMTLAQLGRESRLRIIKSLSMEKPKTKEFLGTLSRTLSEVPARYVLLVDTEIDANLELSARNVPAVNLCYARSLLPSYLARADVVLLTERAALWAQENWS